MVENSHEWTLFIIDFALSEFVKHNIPNIIGIDSNFMLSVVKSNHVMRRYKIDLHEMHDRLRYGGKLTALELRIVKWRLRNPNDSDDIHLLVLVLALGAKSQRANVKLIEHYLQFGEDPYFIDGALRALCDVWGRARYYIMFLLQMTKPIISDSNYEAGLTAFDILSRNINQPSFRGAFNEIYGRWQKLLDEDCRLKASPAYIRGINKIMENALFGEEVKNPNFKKAGRIIYPEWDELLAAEQIKRNNGGQSEVPKFFKVLSPFLRTVQLPFLAQKSLH